MNKRLAIAAVAGTLALAACQSGGGTISGENHQAFYQPGLVNYAARGGHMPLAVYGEPFGPASPEDIAGALRMPGGHVQVPFQATPAAQAGEGGRVVLVFDPAGPMPGGDKVCRLPQGGPETRRDAPSKLAVMAAFCHGDGLASEVQMVTARPASATDPAFQQDMQILLARLLPVRDPTVGGQCPPGIPC